MNQKFFNTPLAVNAVKMTDPFWHKEQELVRTEVIPYQWKAINDQVPGAEPSYCMHNFRVAAHMMREKREKGSAYMEPGYTFRGFQTVPDDPARPEPDRFYGFVFQDTDFSKWIEAVAYSLEQHPDKELEETADRAIDLVCAAQHESGYLDTYYIINGMDRAFTNLRDHQKGAGHRGELGRCGHRPLRLHPLRSGEDRAGFGTDADRVAGRLQHLRRAGAGQARRAGTDSNNGGGFPDCAARLLRNGF